MIQFLSYLVNGIGLGSVYAIIALGYSMVYGIAKMLNFAHGDVIMVGGYTILVFMNIAGNPILATALAVVFCVALGVAVERLAYKPLRGASPLAVLITAIGVSYLLQSLAQILFGSAAKMVSLPNLGVFTFAGIRVQGYTLLTLALSVAVMAAPSLVSRYSPLPELSPRSHRFSWE